MTRSAPAIRIVLLIAGLCLSAALLPASAFAAGTGGGGGGGGGGGSGGGGGGTGGPGIVCWSATGAGPGCAPCALYPAQYPVGFDPATGAWESAVQHPAPLAPWSCGTSTNPTPPSPPFSWNSHLNSTPANGSITTQPPHDFVVFQQVTADSHMAGPTSGAQATCAGNPAAVVVCLAPPVSAGGQTFQYGIRWTTNNRFHFFWDWTPSNPGLAVEQTDPCASVCDFVNGGVTGYRQVHNAVVIHAERTWVAHCFLITGGSPPAPASCTPGPGEWSIDAHTVGHLQQSTSGQHQVDQVEGIGSNH